MVTLAASVAEGLSTLEQSCRDVIVCDIGMPGSDGYAFMQRLRSRPGPHSTVPAIALTAYASREDAARALRAGFQVHMAKPVDPDLLARSIAFLAQNG